MKAQAVQLEEVRDSEERYQLATYKKMPIVAERGEGVWLYTSEGEKYLDLYGGHAVAGTGHSHPHVVAAIQKQAEKLLFYSNLVYSEARALAAEKLISIAPSELTKAFFCNSGTEANENAMRMARMTTGHENIISFSGGFHGRIADAISATFLGKYRELGKPNVPGHLEAEFGNIESDLENIISFSGGFHGRIADAISATFLGKYRELGKPNVPGHLEAEFGNIES